MYMLDFWLIYFTKYNILRQLKHIWRHKPQSQISLARHLNFKVIRK